MASKDDYNEKFAIPEMIRTQKSLCSRLQRDFLLIVVLMFYIFVIKKVAIPGIGETLKYENINIAYSLAIFVVLFISIIAHLFKIYILYRQIDDEVKMFYAHSGSSEDTALQSASAMTAFVISENIVADLVLTGHKRHPSLRRFVVLQCIVVLGAVALSYKMLDDLLIVSFHRLLLVGLICLSYMVLHYFAFKFLFLKRSAFLSRARLARDAVWQYRGLLQALRQFAAAPAPLTPQQVKELVPVMESVQKIADRMISEFTELKLSNILDDDSYVDFLRKNLSEIKEMLGKFSAEQISAVEDMRRRHRSETNILERVEAAWSKLEEVINKSDYALAYNYHVRTLPERNPKNLREFLFAAVK